MLKTNCNKPNINFGGGKGLVIGDVPAAGRGKSAKKGGMYDASGGGQMMATIANMFQALAGPPQMPQWGGNWQPTPNQPQGGWNSGWGNAYQAPPPMTTGGKGTWQAQEPPSDGRKGEKGGATSEMTEEDDKRAYEEWKQCREREMQTEQQAAAGVTLR